MIKNIIFLLFVQFSNYIAPFLVLPYLTRILGVHGFGQIAMALSMCSIAMVLTDFGFNLSGTYWISKNKNNKELVSEYLGCVFIIKFLLSIAGLLLILVSNSYTNLNLDSMSLIAVVGVVFFQGMQMTWFFQGIEKMKNISIISISSKIVYVSLVFILVKEQNDIDLVLVSYFISAVCTTLIGYIYIYRSGFFLRKPNSFAELIFVFKNSYSFFISRAAVGLYTTASTFIVGNAGGNYQAALYSSAEKLYQAGQSLSSPVSQALYPYLSRSGNINELYKYVFAILIPIIIGSVFSFCFSKYILLYIYGVSYVDAENVLRVFMVCLVINFISVNFGYPAFSTISRLDVVNKSVYVGGLIQVGILFFLYNFNLINAFNVVISVLLVELIVMLIRIYFFYYYKKCYTRGASEVIS